MAINGSNYTICHAWAHQAEIADRGGEPYRSGSMRRDEQGRLFSYAACIAKRIDADTFLVNSGDYSVTTQKHKTLARRAIPHGATVWTVGYPDPTTDEEHRQNFIEIKQAAEGTALAAHKERNDSATHYRRTPEDVRDAINHANAYAERFDLKDRIKESAADMIDRVGADHDTKTAATRKAASKQAAETKRERFEAAKRLIAWANDVPSDDIGPEYLDRQAFVDVVDITPDAQHGRGAFHGDHELLAYVTGYVRQNNHPDNDTESDGIQAADVLNALKACKLNQRLYSDTVAYADNIGTLIIDACNLYRRAVDVARQASTRIATLADRLGLACARHHPEDYSDSQRLDYVTAHSSARFGYWDCKPDDRPAEWMPSDNWSQPFSELCHRFRRLPNCITAELVRSDSSVIQTLSELETATDELFSPIRTRYAEERRQREVAKAREEMAGQIKAWRRGDIPRITRYAHAMDVMLRLSPDGEAIETSQGARVPTSIARRVWPTLRAIHNGDASPDALPERWGSFHMSEHNRQHTDGSIVEIGCHRIPYAELGRIAEQLGLPTGPVEYQGTEGQDRESYSDDQDRESYTVSDESDA